ncbi:hypothetical protein SISNIDRAFT_449380 [Sistotremastrum niveocremeum HHB9708]|uniref:GATA-type domain-containing protein n=2 Tax=Sistotremastraceae TaxID=3402574 RepID=A0A164ZJY6_9AGAM|nr:hypothetical protein SISNIDRAFT_449380 [Sistotremastrum niveocremeum HHB9708]KZT42922.1 hypothetical protein SISSUDRAFT_1040800 [Sistotremastrum suecicum HHB10207 ss-3]
MGGGFDSNTAFSSSSNDYHSYQRRASYPYARHENENMGVHEYNNSQTHLPLSADPLALHHHAPLDESPRHYLDSPHSSLHDFDHSDSVKSESPLVVPTQHVLPPMPHIYRPSSSHSQASSNGYPGSQPVVHVMHTDDAASKETQYLRRRCNNCHTTEPPSWRRSTLNPGKIVCNKCGLYERTHLRPRPHRFDELRAGNRARRAATTSSINAKLSPKARPVGSPNFVKKEPRDYEMMQRHNIVRRPSNASIVSSASGNSDWDDSVSAYNSSTPSSTYSSPMMSSFSIPGMPRSASPTGARELDMPIRLPNAPLSDIASMQQTSPGTKSPMKSATSPYYPSITSDHSGRRYSQPDRRYTTGSAPIPPPMVASETGWHTVATDDREAKVEA